MQLHGEKHKLRAPPHRQGLPSATLIKPIIICAVDGYFINPMRKILLYTFYLQIKGILLCVQIEKYIMIRNHFGGPLFNLLPIDCMPVTIIIIRIGQNSHQVYAFSNFIWKTTPCSTGSQESRCLVLSFLIILKRGS